MVKGKRLTGLSNTEEEEDGKTKVSQPSRPQGVELTYL